ncbi:hypothetical protein LTR85_010955 [Meristemomyces frigidus]|nr:hypothetical protein LTR85_010955 [Meristemomyces frigidus]
MSTIADGGPQSPSPSFASAAEFASAATRQGKMEAVPGKMSAILSSFVGDVQEQMNEMRNSQTLLSNEIEAIKERQQTFQLTIDALPQWQADLDAKIAGVQAQLENATNATEGRGVALSDLQAEKRHAQASIDGMREQHDTLSTEVHALASKKDPATSTASASTVVEPMVMAEGLHGPESAAKDLPGHGLSAAGHPSHALQPETQEPVARSVEEDGLSPPTPGPLSPHFYENLMQNATRLMPPPQSRRIREQSVASTVTLCGDDSPEASILRIRPLPPAIRLNLSAAPVLRSKRKHTSQASVVSSNQDGATMPLVEGSKRKRRSIAPTLQRGGGEVEAEEGVSYIDMETKAAPAESDPTLNIKLCDTQASDEYDDDEIVVAPRRTVINAAILSPVVAAFESPTTASPDHAALVDELLDSINDSSTPPTTSAMSPASVAWQRSRAGLVEVVLPGKAADDESRKGTRSSGRKGLLLPPKTPKSVGLAELHKQFGVRSDGKENTVAVSGEATQDSIAFGTARRSLCTPKPQLPFGA